jgi:hypothetical protein
MNDIKRSTEEECIDFILTSFASSRMKESHPDMPSMVTMKIIDIFIGHP